MVEWRAVPGFEGRYEVSSDGQVRSLARVLRFIWRGKPKERPLPAKLLKPTLDQDGYPRVVLYLGGVRHEAPVHRLVLLAFVGPRPPGAVARHLDDIPLNNTPGNLAWGTVLDNAADALANDRYHRGSRHYHAKLTEADVMAIRAARGKETNHQLSARYGVAYQHISLIQLRKCWKHVGDAPEQKAA